MYKVYMYTNLLNGKKYCGMTKRKLSQRAGKDGILYKECTRFYSDIVKYGFDSFKREILFDGLTKEEAEEKEIETIEKYNLTNPINGYNIHYGGRKVNREACARKGKQNGMYKNGDKLSGGKNGRARKAKVIFPDSSIKIFNTQKEAREYLNISKDMFRSVRDYEGKFVFSKMTNKDKIEKNKHLIGIEIIVE